MLSGRTVDVRAATGSVIYVRTDKANRRVRDVFERRTFILIEPAALCAALAPGKPEKLFVDTVYLLRRLVRVKVFATLTVGLAAPKSCR